MAAVRALPPAIPLPSLRKQAPTHREEQTSRTALRTNHHAAALWLGAAKAIFDPIRCPWLRDIVSAYSAWTWIANGSLLEKDDDPDNIPDEWNQSYFALFASCLPGLTISQIDEAAVQPILRLPGNAFLDVTSTFLPLIDTEYFNRTDLDDTAAAHVRTSLARRMMQSNQWVWLRTDT